MYHFDYVVFIGRFQPFHLAHLQTIQIALTKSEKVIVGLGSAQPERTLKNPFIVAEREQMILSNFSLEDQARIEFVHIIDVYDDKKWVALVKQVVQEKVVQGSQVGLIGHFKDDSSYYLSLFPTWQLIELDSLQNSISATPIREAFYQGDIQTQFLPQGTIEFLKNFQRTPIYQQLQQQFLIKQPS
ncbi:nicotinate-nicotinamide nucleotide adenylyltransferase [Acinetobacter sp. MD2(2019)]|uniref:nicotinate-nicotinamide nucleotide adenylyltransferase n=1 Tax=Acinetobacter sp. MD2(2019) TaxID=2605273 RepID=UPI002D1F541D|nr:nicotinate-nicotinamide nucleotide adenylyltransferase [Acinetobacter sp. MD2(2019)]MEB3753499.1 nicotinate-nicotinamide nucleotide adenylyltransferase [Acinetobacter sp. MD2(2019)]